jgi:O-antigen/teichoic acid export membrane protein
MSPHSESTPPPAGDDTGTLREKTVRGVAWAFAEMFGRYGVTWIVTIYLARLLTPADYGIVGLVMAFLIIAAVIIEGGFKTALIRKKDVTPTDYNTVFLTNLALSFVIYTIVCICAPHIARFSGEPQLTELIRLLGVTLIINAMTIVQNIELRRTMRFNLLFAITVPAEILSGTTAIWLAYSGFGALSLVAKIVLSSISVMILYRCTVRWRPKFEFCTKSFRELFKTGGWLTLAAALWVYCTNMSTILIGRIFSMQQLGYYSFSSGIINMTSNSVTTAVQQVSLTSFSKIQNENERLVSAQKQVVQSTAAITFPMMTVLAIMAEPLFTLFLNESWIPAIPYLRVICVSGALASIHSITNNALLVKNIKLYLKIDFTAALTLAILIFTLIPAGIDVFLIGRAVHALIFIAIIDFFKSRRLSCQFGSVFGHIAPIALSSAVMGTVIYFMMPLFDNIGLAQCAVLMTAAMAVYGLCLWTLKADAFINIVDTVRRILRIRRNNKLSRR